MAIISSQASASQSVPLTEETKAKIAYKTVVQLKAIDDPKLLFEVAFVSRALRNNPHIDRSQLANLMLLVRDKWQIAGGDRWGYAVDVSDRIMSGILDVIKLSDSKYADLAKALYDDVLMPTIKDFAANKDYVTGVSTRYSLWYIARGEKGKQIIERFRSACLQNANT